MQVQRHLVIETCKYTETITWGKKWCFKAVDK